VGGIDAIRVQLNAVGLDDADIDELALRVCAVNAYAEQRLRPRISVSMQEIETAYRRLAVELESQGETAPLLTSVQEQLHRLITERKLNDEIERWTARIAEEREVTRFVR
jgi:DNA-binding transcriptional regulator GbsR (MarR family)